MSLCQDIWLNISQGGLYRKFWKSKSNWLFDFCKICEHIPQLSSDFLKFINFILYSIMFILDSNAQSQSRKVAQSWQLRISC